jgi:hypothetical protein
MPDEVAEGHAGRMARLNGLPSARALAGVVRRGTDLQEEEIAKTLLRLLAAADDSTADEYCQRHSLYPYRRMVTSMDQKGFLESQRKQFLRPHLLAHNKPRFCQVCASSDFAAHGFSWYRRRHDIPGIDYCVVHGGTLFEVDGEQPFSRLPHETLGSEASALVRAKHENISTAPVFIRNYARAYLALGNVGSRLDKDGVAMVLLQRSMKLMGGATTQKLSRIVTRQMTVCQAPAVWLQQFSFQQDLAAGLAALNNRRLEVANEHVALAIAALFKEPETAIRDFQRIQVSPEFAMIRGVHGRQLRRLIRDPSWPSYWRNASWLGYQVSAVSSRNAAGVEWDMIPKLADLEQAGTWRALKSFCDGSSLRQACSMHGTDTAEIERFLRTEARMFCALVEKLRELSRHDHSQDSDSTRSFYRRVDSGELALPGARQLEGATESLAFALARADLWIDGTQAGQRLVPGTDKPKDEVRLARRQGRIVGLFDGVQFLYPTFQFTQSGEPLPGVVELMRLLPVKRDGSIAPHAARWLFTPNPALKMQSPSEAFERAPERVVAAASARGHRRPVPD